MPPGQMRRCAPPATRPPCFKTCSAWRWSPRLWHRLLQARQRREGRQTRQSRRAAQQPQWRPPPAQSWPACLTAWPAACELRAVRRPSVRSRMGGTASWSGLLAPRGARAKRRAPRASCSRPRFCWGCAGSCTPPCLPPPRPVCTSRKCGGVGPRAGAMVGGEKAQRAGPLTALHPTHPRP